MSITEELIRLRQAKEDLRNAINAKGGSLTSEKLDLYAEAVLNLKNSSGTVNPDNAGSSGSSVMDFYKCTSLINEQNVDYIVTTRYGVQDPSLAGTRFRLTRCPEKDYTIQYEIPEATEPVEGKAFAYSYVRDDGKTVYCENLEGRNMDGTRLYELGNLTFGPPSGAEFYVWGTLETVDIQEWSGNKAILTDGVYSFEENVTSGLTYGTGFTPEVGKIYNGDATVRVEKLFEGASAVPEDGLVFYMPFKGTAQPEVGVVDRATENMPGYGEQAGIQYATFSGSEYFCGKLTAPVGGSGGAFSMACSFKVTGTSVNQKILQLNDFEALQIRDYYGTNVFAAIDVNLGGIPSDWMSVVFTWDGDYNNPLQVYKNGQLAGTTSRWPQATDMLYIGVAQYWESVYAFYGNMFDVAVWNRVLTPEEIADAVLFALHARKGMNFSELTLQPQRNQIQRKK